MQGTTERPRAHSAECNADRQRLPAKGDYRAHPRPSGVAAFMSAHSKPPCITPGTDSSSGKGVVWGHRGQQLGFALIVELLLFYYLSATCSGRGGRGRGLAHPCWQRVRRLGAARPTPPLVPTILSVLTTFPICYTICMRNHRILIGNVV